MKNLILAIAIAITPSAVMADGPSRESHAVITAVHPIYVNQHVERIERECYNVDVPVYGTVHGGSDGDVLAGALIGGVIGNQFGNGSGKEAMTVLGAILGANRGANSTRDAVVGYRVEQRCENVRRVVNEPVLSHYRISYTYNGHEYHQETHRKYTLGQRVSVQPNLK